MATSKYSADIIIVGAGLGGLSAAISCALAGHKVCVYEGARELAEVGAGLQITPNASKLLQQWGLGPEMTEVWAEPTELVVHRYSDGKVLAMEKDFDKNIRAKYGAPFVDMHRVDMQKMLYNKAVELGVKIHLASKIDSVRQTSSGPEICLRSGETHSADLVVGADGLWSRCRDSMLGQSDKPLPTGDLAYRIVLTLDQIEDPELQAWVSNPTCHFWVGPYAHAVGYSVRSGTMYNLVLLCPDDLPNEVSKQAASVAEMRKLFTGWDPILTRFLECVTSVDKWKLMHRAEVESWTNAEKNFVLIGDACHPMLPYLAQGANSSIEDGGVLGRLLSYVQSKDQIPQAIRMYEKLRKQRSDLIVRETFHQRNAFHMPDGSEQQARDRLFEEQLKLDQLTTKFPSRWTCPEVQPWLYGYDAYQEADAAIKANPFQLNNQPTDFVAHNHVDTMPQTSRMQLVT